MPSTKAPAPRRKTTAKPAARTPAVAPVGVASGAAPAVADKPSAGPPFWSAEFWSQVRAEVRKITWPTWKETWITSVMVAIMVTFTAVFFLVVDGSLSFLLQQVLKLAS